MALPTNLTTLNYSWNGKLFCQIPAKSAVALSTMDYSWNGKTFWGNSQISAVYGAILKRWTGAAWVKEPLKVYVGGSWQTKPLKVYKGGEWKLVDITGV